jgi:beta-phosphoglucomutase
MTRGNKAAVLWDMDGVIADTGFYHMRSWQETFHQTGITFTKTDFNRVFGMRSDEIIRSVLGKDFTLEKMQTIMELKETTFRRLYRDNIKSFPGAIELIKSLNEAHFKQALVSSTPIENINLITGTLGIRACFDEIISGGDVTEGKPSPQGYLLAARKLGVVPAKCVVIEDAVVGVCAAKAGGMTCIAVTNTHPTEKLVEADLVVDSLEKVDVVVVERLIK